MTDRELRRLNRSGLLELLIQQRKEIAALKKELEETREQLNSRRIELRQAGSIAEAALRLNHIFEAAENAAAQYLENVKILSQQEELTDEAEKDSDTAHPGAAGT